MSYGVDLAIEMAIDHEIYEEINIRNMERRVWTMRDGKEIPLSDMTTKHIQNCIRMLERGTPDDIAEMWVRTFTEELNRREEVVFA